MTDEVVKSYSTVMPGRPGMEDQNILELVGVPTSDLSVREERRVESAMGHGDLYPSTVREYQSGAIEVETAICEPEGLVTLRFAGRRDGTSAVTAQEAMLALASAVERFV